MATRFIVLCVFLYVIYKDAAQAQICDNPGDPAAIAQIELKIYNGTSSDLSYVSTKVMEPEKIESLISPNKDTVFYIHGYTDNSEKEIVKIVARAYLDKGDVNFILGDWGYIADNLNYIYDAGNVPGVGKAYAQAIMNLSNAINTSTLHVMGHSMGAHVAAHVARNLNFTLSRLTCTDPAYPLFYPSNCHIRDGDAKIVVILHTDAGVLGTPFRTGSVDFWANGGTNPQPGCSTIESVSDNVQALTTNGTLCDSYTMQNVKAEDAGCRDILQPGDLCSHLRSVRFYAESVTRPTAFPAKPCRNTTDTESSGVVYFGDSVPMDTRGEYCFETNAHSPYGQGS